LSQPERRRKLPAYQYGFGARRGGIEFIAITEPSTMRVKTAAVLHRRDRICDVLGTLGFALR
jgi:hypothetical protein